MKKRLTGLFLLCFIGTGLSAKDTLQTQFLFLPMVSYSSDFGLEYGITGNVFLSRKNQPTFDHALYADLSRTTRANYFARLFYETTRLIPNARMMLDLSYMDDLGYGFYGFNGYESVYNKEIDQSNRTFYKYHRKLFRARADIHGRFPAKHWQWVLGYEFSHFGISALDPSELNHNSNSPLPEKISLYQKYLDWGLLSTAESGGGNVHSVKAGIFYDSRDSRLIPSQGIWSEAVVQTTPRFLLNSDNAYTVLALIHRQYIALYRKRLTLAYRLTCQTTLGGQNEPFYAKPLMLSSYQLGSTMEGLGGDRSMRGVARNRIIGEGFVLGNFELRYRLFRLRILKQDLEVVPHVFWDTGRIVKRTKFDLSLIPAEERELFFAPDTERFHHSIGAGARLLVNSHFAISGNIGKSLNPQDGDSSLGIYVGAGVMF